MTFCLLEYFSQSTLHPSYFIFLFLSYLHSICMYLPFYKCVTLEIEEFENIEPEWSENSGGPPSSRTVSITHSSRSHSGWFCQCHSRSRFFSQVLFANL